MGAATPPSPERGIPAHSVFLVCCKLSGEIRISEPVLRSPVVFRAKDGSPEEYLASFRLETAKNRMNTGFRAGKPRGLYAGRGPGRAKNRTRQAMKAVTGRVGASVADEIGVSVTREKLSGASAWFALFDEHLGDFQKVVGQNGDADE